MSRSAIKTIQVIFTNEDGTATVQSVNPRGHYNTDAIMLMANIQRAVDNPQTPAQLSATNYHEGVF